MHEGRESGQGAGRLQLRFKCNALRRAGPVLVPLLPVPRGLEHEQGLESSRVGSDGASVEKKAGECDRFVFFLSLATRELSC